MGRSGYQSCDQCNYRWAPCGDQYCSGYRLVLDGVEPTIKGCPNCDAEHGGIDSAVARWWPSAWRAMARKLDDTHEERVAKTSGGLNAEKAEVPRATR